MNIENIGSLYEGKRCSIFSMLEAPPTIFYTALSNPTQQLKSMWKTVNLSEWSWKWRGQPSRYSVAEKQMEETAQKSLTGQDTGGDWIKTKKSFKNIYVSLIYYLCFSLFLPEQRIVIYLACGMQQKQGNTNYFFFPTKFHKCEIDCLPLLLIIHKT